MTCNVGWRFVYPLSQIDFFSWSSSLMARCFLNAQSQHYILLIIHVNLSNTVALNIFYSGIKYTENDWLRRRHKVRHYPLLCVNLAGCVRRGEVPRCLNMQPERST